MNTPSARADALANRLISGAKKLGEFAETLSDSEWKQPVSGDGRAIGIVIHHVASVYPIEVELAQLLGKGTAITEVTKQAIDTMNAEHAVANKFPDKQETLELLSTNSQNAARAIRAFTDQQLDSAAPVSLYYDAPLTAQFFIEDHALRHSYHHLGKIKSSL